MSDCIAVSFPFLCGGLVPEIQRHCCFNGNASSGTLIELRGGVYVVRTADGVGKCVVR